MAGILLSMGDRPNTNIMEFCCDTVDEVNDAPTMTEHGKGVFSDYKICAPMGSKLYVGNQGGKLLVYMLFSFGWKPLNSNS